MTNIVLPFFLRSKSAEPGRRRFGWVDVEVEVPEVQSEGSFELAIHSREPCGNMNWPLRRCYYVHDGELWLAQNPDLGADQMFNFFGVQAETPIANFSSTGLRELTSTVSRNIHLNAGFGVASPSLSSKETFRTIESVDPQNINQVRSWASKSLIMVDGVLLRKVSQPAIVLRVLDDVHEPVNAALQYMELQYGIHFAQADEDFSHLLAEAERRFGGGRAGHEIRTASSSYVPHLYGLGLQQKFSIVGTTALDNDVLAGLDNEGRIRAECVVSLGRTILRKHMLWSKSHKRHVEEKRAIQVAIDSIQDCSVHLEEGSEVIAEQLQRLPMDSYPNWFRWQFDRAMERYHDRPISAPNASSTLLSL